MPSGVLKKWDKQRKFGFIQPDQADEKGDVFIHISGFKNQRHPVIVGQRLNYRVVPGRQEGKFQAVDAAPTDARDAAQAPTSAAFSGYFRLSPALVLAMLLSVFCVGSAVMFWIREHSLVLFLAYLIASLLIFGLYTLDKYRATQGAWRIPENTLHLVELAGGWPGAFIAQRLVRHKTVKLSYQIVYWLIVAVHLGLWGQYWYAPASSLLQRYAA